MMTKLLLVVSSWMAALYLMIGRSELGRFVPAVGGDDWVVQVRTWTIVGLLLSGAALFARSRTPGLETTVRQRSLLVTSSSVLVLLGWMATSSGWASAPSTTQGKVFEVAAIGLATLALCLILLGAREYARRWAGLFWLWIVAAASILAIASLFEVLGTGSPKRLAVFGGGPNVFGRLMTYFVIASLFLYQRWRLNPIILLVPTVASILVLLTGSRGGFISLVGALSVLVLTGRREPVKVGGAVIFAGAGLWVVTAWTQVGRLALEFYQGRVVRLLFKEQYFGPREDLYRAAFDMGRGHPIAGEGLGSFASTGLHVYPHNLFLELFAEGGLVAVCLLLLVLVGGLGAVWLGRRKRESLPAFSLTAANLAGFMAIFLAAQFSGDLYDSRGVFFFLQLLAVRTEVPDQGGLVPKQA